MSHRYLVERALRALPPPKAAVLVFPSFQVDAASDAAAGSGVCPTSASELATALRRGHVSVFHAAGEGQKGIELERWWSANTTARARTDGSSPPKREQAAADGAADDVAAPYPLPSSLPFGFEPFYAFSKAAGVPAFDESFRGLGFNRISQARAHPTC